MNKFWFNTWKLIWHAYVDLQMWLLNEQIVIQCLEPYSITCLCWCAHVDAKWTKLWFDASKLIQWHAYVDLQMWFDASKLIRWHAYVDLQMWFDASKLIRWHAYVDLQMWLSNEQIVIRCLEPYSITCLCWSAHVDVKWTKLWFDTWKLIRWHAYVDLHMCLSNVQILIQHLEAYLTACQFAHVDAKWTNCDSTLASLFNMLMSICKCWMNKLFTWHGFCFPSSFKMNKFSFHVLSTCAHEMWNEHCFCICENGVKKIDKPGDLTSRFVWWACDWEAFWQKANLPNPRLLSMTVLEQGVKELMQKLEETCTEMQQGAENHICEGGSKLMLQLLQYYVDITPAAGVASSGWW